MIWKKEYEIGVELVDKQHQELFKRLGNFIQTVRSDQEKSKKKAEIEKTLNFMGEYVVTHFDAEEALQKNMIILIMMNIIKFMKILRQK